MKKIVGLLLFIALGLALALTPRLRTAGFWQALASPGALARPHAFLQDNCSGCHARIDGVEPARCVTCHANETALLQRQATAFHANIGSCAACHREHEGDAALRPGMNHVALAEIGLQLLASAPEDSDARLLQAHLIAHGPADDSFRSGAVTSRARESLLDCYGCHETRDRHAGQFGRECAACHNTAQWTLPAFKHPAPSSMDCAQCHRAPPSHSMGHFAMVSKRVAGVEHAVVSQCYLCHQTTSWNDIKSVGMYDHH